MTRDCEPAAYRPVELLRYKWTVSVVGALDDGSRRFNELKRAVGDAPANVLSERLKQLERADIVSRTVEDTTPPSVCYELTVRGRELADVIDDLERV